MPKDRKSTQLGEGSPKPLLEDSEEASSSPLATVFLTQTGISHHT